MTSDVMVENAYLVGVDGGGTGTRVVLARASAPEVELARGFGGPSGLSLGIEAAWRSIEQATQQAFDAAGWPLDWTRCALGCGLAGVNHAAWRTAFLATAPHPVAALRLESDAYTTLLGAHGGEPGVVIALGTGSVGLALDAQGRLQMCRGFGFPSGDEASGAWLGLRAIAHAQRAADGRGPMDDFARALLSAIGVGADALAHCRPALQAWVVGANQTAYAALAPIVIAHDRHPVVDALLRQAGADVGAMADAVDRPRALPLALCGSLANAITPYIDASHAARRVAPRGDAASGALRLAAGALAERSDAD